MSPDPKVLVQNAANLMQKAVEAAFEDGKRAGIELGVKQERERVQRVLYPENPDQKAQPSERPKVAPHVPVRGVTAVANFTEMAKRMLASDREHSFSISEAVAYFQRTYSARATPDQMRAILKVLARRDEARRTGRGEYSAGPKLTVQRTLLGAA